MLYLPGSIFKVSYNLKVYKKEINRSFYAMLIWIGENEYRLVCLDDANIFSTRPLTDTEDEEWNGFTLEELETYVQLGASAKIELTYVKNIKDVCILL